MTTGTFPNSIAAIDVETTGLYSDDRIVTIGAWRVDAADFRRDSLNVQCLHIIADPGKKSHPRAEEVHGYNDWTLRHQEPFSAHSLEIRNFLADADLVIAHNASFDIGFIDREYRQLGQPHPIARHYCTMNAYRRSGLPGRASLNAICQEMGLRREGKKHGALEDAWLALMVYFWLNKLPTKHIQPFSIVASKGAPVVPSNFTMPPPLPPGPLPRRSSQTKILGSSTNIASSNTNTTLLKAVRPTAVLMLEVARSDAGLAQEEIEILVSLIRSTGERLAIPCGEDVEREILMELLDIEVTQNILTRSARAMCEDSYARDAFPKWFSTIATADGELSIKERDAVDRVKAAIRRALPKVDT